MISRAAGTAVGILVTLVVLFGGWRLWESWRDRQSATYTAAIEAARLDSIRVRQLADSLARARGETVRVETVVVERAVTLWRDRPARPRSPTDTLSLDSLKQALTERDAYIDTLEVRGSVLVAALDTTRQALLDYRSFADSTMAVLARENRNLRIALETGRPRRRCGLGAGGGYGVTLASGTVHYGPSVTVGISCSL